MVTTATTFLSPCDDTSPSRLWSLASRLEAASLGALVAYHMETVCFSTPTPAHRKLVCYLLVASLVNCANDHQLSHISPFAL